MHNLLRVTYVGDNNWTCPGGVGQVRVTTVAFIPELMNPGSSFMNAGIYNGAIYSWGANSSGQLGVGNTTPRSSPVLVVGAGGTETFRMTSCGGVHGLGLTCTGIAWAWGNNSDGRLGTGGIVNTSSPAAVVGGNTWRALSAGSIQSYGIDVTGDAYAWGGNTNGGLGIGNVTAQSSPILVLGGFKWSSLSGGANGATGLISDGTAYGFGVNNKGQIGDGTTVAKSSPIAVLGGRTYQQLSRGWSHSLAIDESNNLWAWGENTSGALGDGSVVSKSSPVLVLGGKKWMSCVAGANYSLGIDSSGDAYAWGENTNGGLGLGDVVPRSSPVVVLRSKKWVYLSAGELNSSYGIDSIGDMYAWGNNVSGELGLGDVTPRSSPVAILGGFKWNSVTQAVVNNTVFRVIPGQIYPIKLSGFLAAFGGNTTYQSPYGSGTICTKIILEYEA